MQRTNDEADLVLKLMEKMPDDRFAFIVFAGRAYLLMPLTADHAATTMVLLPHPAQPHSGKPAITQNPRKLATSIKQDRYWPRFLKI